ncbi:hypothetical protein D9756_001400 [Leucocoprinus leucothites]|uniref:DUF726-domain-containing protein n=1 Tax=Leucocoprinus leucothites TaxID=201217 RepID=A0A8H5G4P2_9AGAR|nr:hypothetical protein D9756_001400 [Leucoagaricus leucothites]
MPTDIEKITPPRELTAQEKNTVFQHFFRRLAAFRNTYDIYARRECDNSEPSKGASEETRNEFIRSLNQWAQELTHKAWIVCRKSEDYATEAEKCPEVDEFADTSIAGLPPMPSEEAVNKTFTTILFLHITTSKQYSAYTRAFFAQFKPHVIVDEDTIVKVLKNPETVAAQAQTHTEAMRTTHADRSYIKRIASISLGAVAGGVLIGVTGGFAAPLVAAGVTSVLGWFGLSGTAVGLMMTGLAGSSMVCGALFGAYGAKSTGEMVERYMREVRDLAVLPVGVKEGEETLGIRLCVSGWLTDESDVRKPWTIFEGDDTFALQWEIEALKALSDAMYGLVKSHAMKYVKAEVIRRTVFAGLMSALSPVALLKIGELIDNPWMTARARAQKTGLVLAELIAKRAFGNRPITLVGYSLGSLVIFEALRELAKLPISESFGLVEDVFLFGTPTAPGPGVWAKVRRVVAGRLVNGYASNDYVLAILTRATVVSWTVAGLGPVEVQGVEDVHCNEVTGHTMWRGMVGKYLEECKARGIVQSAVSKHVQEAEHEKAEIAEESEQAIEKAPGELTPPSLN